MSAVLPILPLRGDRVKNRSSVGTVAGPSWPLHFYINYGMMRSVEETTPWSIEFYITARGDCPGEAYIAKLPEQEQAAVYRYLDLLRQFGVGLGMPIARHIEGALWELRPGAHRVFYFIATERRCIILSGYRKKGDRTPKREIDRASRYMADWLGREGR